MQGEGGYSEKKKFPLKRLIRKVRKIALMNLNSPRNEITIHYQDNT